MLGARCQALMMGSVASDGTDRSSTLLIDTENPSVPQVSTDTLQQVLGVRC